jgi:hypothetical protein
MIPPLNSEYGGADSDQLKETAGHQTKDRRGCGGD